MTNTDIINKGIEGEENFKSWLDKEEFSFLHINQSKETLASLFSKKIKRPDFFVLVDCVGLIAVDVKNKEMSRGVFTLDKEPEVKDVLAFERIFRIPIWYVYQGKNNGWYWISALKVLEVAEIRKEKNGKEFLSIKKEHFIKVRKAEDFAKIYNQKLTHAIKEELSGLIF